GEFQRKLYKELVKNYNPDVIPTQRDRPVTVYFSLSLLQIMDVDEKNQVVDVVIWLQMSWTDHYLQWNVSEYPGVKQVSVPISSLWKPDILLYNAIERPEVLTPQLALVNSSGHVQYLPSIRQRFSCDVSGVDTESGATCKLKFGSWTHHSRELDLQMQEADISGYIPYSRFELVGVTQKRSERFYECCKEPYPDVTFTVTFRKKG
uniref:Humanized alpha-AChBP n=1 Tax=Homo sapiens TaxID=9606 RepID=UPI000C21032F|nr:Chain A, Humanized alpha-AChBP [Homo sapiens]5OUG_B Chain B, Humanized alpha-AChBP [Homo sapiens]5OUG_C Chain C, Humanized alpha-AChBP [Homo sapiens]5OUG_D Chain D, Humanized alpha-AChBP [Homo sapiens]5OUG_E Chain E, Humanized alpha-AChBP [Homo sapiens]5OUH_A Chain A, Acetylcholine binding protein [Homo sapiens]5OUH_B Chain B, Acetylcholine binding protein [Homo sapiens]5OUH_C Chain C, Acetylcholine binding protein [Homo sapiens]5OUH_D Chain D, Acetylcholine binding protein [Homo sapiens